VKVGKEIKFLFFFNFFFILGIMRAVKKYDFNLLPNDVQGLTIF
jgi:hypothetical protein